MHSLTANQELCMMGINRQKFIKQEKTLSELNLLVEKLITQNI